MTWLKIDEPWLASVEATDNLFPEIKPGYFGA